MANSNSTKKKNKIKLSRELSDIVIYTQSLKFSSFDDAQKNSKFFNISSIDENKCFKFCQDDADKLTRHTASQLIRIYPAGKRVDSSNYVPILPWACGCQIVALNYQTTCEEMLINQCKFRINGNTGYVIKPDFMLPGSNFNPNDLSTFPSTLARKYVIQIISGQQIPKPHQSTKGEVVDPYIKMAVRGCSVDTNDANKFTTTVISDNGFSPRWDQEVTFKVHLPQLAFLEIIVYDKDKRSKDDKLGHAYLPMDHIRQGYRNIPLYNKEGATLQPANLFFHFNISDL